MMIDLASAYSRHPSGRFPADGQFNGQRFRNDILEPALRQAKLAGDGSKVIVDIDGVRSFGSSFLEEAFAGLVRLGTFTAPELNALLEIKCTKPYLFFFRDAINSLIRSAEFERQAG